MASEIIAVGMACYDHVVVVPTLRAVENGCRVQDVILQGGGVAATAAVAARALGARTQLWARVGNDTQGEFIVDDLRKRGVDTSHLQVIEGGRTPISTVLVEQSSGERRFLYFSGRSLDTHWNPPEYDRLERARALIVDGRWPGVCLAAVRRARAGGVPVIADLGHASDEEMAILGLCDYPVVSEVAYSELAGDKSAAEFSDQLLEANAKAVILTRGGEGVWLRTKDEGPLKLGAFAIDTIDTTGAGDVFHGAFAVALSEGQGIKESVEFASAAAAHACTALGCRGAVPTRDDVEKLLGGDKPEWMPAD